MDSVLIRLLIRAVTPLDVVKCNMQTGDDLRVVVPYLTLKSAVANGLGD